MSKSDVAPSSLGIRRVDGAVVDEAISMSPADLRDALQRAHDGESPDALVEEVRTVDCE